tara:strand:- start:773 stop:1042 length:270 start_codon:yes stop_codon:yes gene_type:complete
MMIQFEEKHSSALRELIFILVPIGNIFSSACAVNNEHNQGAPFAVFALFDRSENAARGRDGGMAGLAGRACLSNGTRLDRKGKQVVPQA